MHLEAYQIKLMFCCFLLFRNMLCHLSLHTQHTRGVKEEKDLGEHFNSCLYMTGLFFHRFFKITNKWISRILEFRKKSLSLGKKSLSLGGKFLSLGGEFSSFMWKLTIFALKLHKNCRIFEFGFKTCLSLEKVL